jgi:hypothetical protein
VSDCVAKAVKLTPEELQKIAVQQAITACKAEAKGKEDQVAGESEIREQLPLECSQGLSSRRRSVAKRAQYGRSSTVHTRGDGMYAERLL